MDRDDWISALRLSCENLFLSEENILTMFTSTGHKFESILSRDVNSVSNIPDIYDATRDLFFIIKKLFEILPGSTVLNEYEIEGESMRFNSYRLGFQRRLNILTPVEFNQVFILKFIGSTINFFPDKIIGAIGDKETSVLHWPSTETDESIPLFFYRAAIADGNSLLERSQMDMNIGTIKQVKITTDKRSFLLTTTDSSEDIFLIEDYDKNNEWLTRLIALLNRFTKDNKYFLPELEEIDKEIIVQMSFVILRRFLSYLLPPKKKGSIPFSKIAQMTNIPEEILIHYFEDNIDQKLLSQFGLILKKEEFQTKKTQTVNYTFVIDKLSDTRVLSYYLMEINRFFDQYVNILPSKEKSASSSGFNQYQSTSSYLGTIWGSFIFGSVLGESDTLFNLNSEIIKEIKELIDYKTDLSQLKNDIEKYSKVSEKPIEGVIGQFRQKFEFNQRILLEKISQLNEKIAFFTKAIIQSYYRLLQIISLPIQISTPKTDQSFQSALEFTFEINGKKRILNDDAKGWITLVFFGQILQKGDAKSFLKSLSPELISYYEIVSSVWDKLQLLSEKLEEWTITSQVNLLYLKPSKRRDMLLKFLNIKN